MPGHPAVAALDDLADVDLTTSAPTNGQVLSFNSATGLWTPGTVATSSLVLTATAADIKAIAAAGALGSSSKAAPADHVHLGTHAKRGALHTDKYRRATALAESIDRDSAKDSITPSAGRGLAAAIILPAGTAVTKIGFRTSSTTAGASLTHTWFALTDSSFNKLAVTADDTSASWAINTDKLLTVTGGPYSITSEDLYYLICVQIGTTAGTLLGAGIPSGFSQVSPILGCSVNPTGLTDPTTAPTAFTLNSGNGHAYAWVE